MTSTIAFTKMTGAGNEFLVVDARRRVRPRAWPVIARALCDRRRGIGADGLLVLEPARGADARMRVFNADGSEAEMCGNGARCVALYLRSRGTWNVKRETSVTIDTKAGILSAVVREERVALAMTDPTALHLGGSLEVEGWRLTYGFLNTGVPHVVIPVRNVDRVDVQRLGRAIRCHRRFAPHGTNVNFIQPDPRRRNRLRVRTYERGVEAETLACGTGVTASAIVFALQQREPRSSYRLEVIPRSGDRLAVSFEAARNGGGGWRVRHVVLAGPARRVCDGSVRWPLKGVP